MDGWLNEGKNYFDLIAIWHGLSDPPTSHVKDEHYYSSASESDAFPNVKMSQLLWLNFLSFMHH